MRKKIRIVVVAGVIAAVGGIAIAARDAKDEGKAAAPPAGAPMAPQVPVAEVITARSRHRPSTPASWPRPRPSSCARGSAAPSMR